MRSSTSGSVVSTIGLSPSVSKGKSIAARQQQPTSVNDVIAGDRRDQPPRPGAKLQVGHGFQEAPRQRRAGHRRRDRDNGKNGIERGGLIDDAAEIDQLHEMTGHLTGGPGPRAAAAARFSS